jgi:hypothetical protein
MTIKFIGHEGDDHVFEMEDDDKTPVKVEKTEEVEIVDDTPDEDKGKQPMPKHIVDEIEADDLETYDKAAKARLKQLKKVWHDERREKEREAREKAEAVALSRRLLDENKKLRGTIETGTKQYVDTYKSAAELEMEAARKAYTEAYDSGDSVALLKAQESLHEAQYKLNAAKNFKPPLQDSNITVDEEQQVQKPTVHPTTKAWQDRNTWYGTNKAMTGFAFGRHQELLEEHGESYVGTEQYWKKLDASVQKAFPDYFGDEKPSGGETKPKRNAKPTTVVAPASRSTSPKKIVLRQSQVDLAKKLGLTTEQYARQYAKEQMETEQ